MSDVLPLPAKANLNEYEKLAADFQEVCRSDDAAAVREWAQAWVERLAQGRGRTITPDVQREIRLDVERVERQWDDVRKSKDGVGQCELATAQYFIARCHGFVSWPEFAAHLEGIQRTDSPVSEFELAVDAVVNGDTDRLGALLRANPALVRMRSTREHQSTLLHYVSANGVEDFRQKTPENIVEIAKLLLDAGAEANAESEAYGGRSTTLGLTATSYHPQAAGVQLALMRLLIGYGANIDHRDGSSAVNDCLHNGRGEAAEFLASRGGRLDLEGAAGVGRLDVVSKFFHEDGSLRPPATPVQVTNGFAWACEFGRTSIVDFLLQRGMDVNARLPHDGQTGLHWAACGGHGDTVKLLLAKGSDVASRDSSYNGTPLDWMLYGWGNSNEAAGRRYLRVAALLARAGAKLDSAWFAGEDEDRLLAIRKLRSDPAMRAALSGEGDVAD